MWRSSPQLPVLAVEVLPARALVGIAALVDAHWRNADKNVGTVIVLRFPYFEVAR